MLLSTIVWGYLLLVVIYVAWDAFMFTVVHKSLYRAYYNGITNYWAAASIYFLYPAAVILLTLAPTAQETALKGVVLGLTGYGLYHFTNMATLERWPVETASRLKTWPHKMISVDIVIGVAITTILSLINWALQRGLVETIFE